MTALEAIAELTKEEAENRQPLEPLSEDSAGAKLEQAKRDLKEGERLLGAA